MQATKRHETCFLACHCGMLHGAQDHAAAQGRYLVGTDPMPNAYTTIVFHITMAGSGPVLDRVRCSPPPSRLRLQISDAADIRAGRGRFVTLEIVRFWQLLALKFSCALRTMQNSMNLPSSPARARDRGPSVWTFAAENRFGTKDCHTQPSVPLHNSSDS